MPRWTADGQMTLPQVLQNAVARWGDRPSFDFDGQAASYVDLERESLSFAHGLLALGVRKGDTVCTMLDTSLDALFLFYAIARIGAISVPINTSYRGEFLRHQVADTGAALIIAEKDFALRVADLAASLPELRTLVCRGEGGGDAVVDGGGMSVLPISALRTGRSEPVDVVVEPADIALLIYTSGTTGPSKGCMLPHAAICNNARQLIDVLDLTERDTYWTPLPLFHMNGIAAAVVGAPMVGARCAVAPRFSLSGFWPEIERTGATAACLIGSMIVLVLNAGKTAEANRCFGQLRAVFGAPFPEDVKAAWREAFGVGVIGQSGYGMTETTMVTALKLGDPSPPGTSGRVTDDFEIRIVGEAGDECAPDEAGEVIVRPRRPNIMFAGYWRRPEATLQAFRDLWFRSGDVGSLDETGFFTFRDRKKDYLRRGGENISSFEVEATFRAHPEIEDLAAHAVPSELTEDEVKVTAIRKPGATVTEEELCRWAVDRMPHFAVPRYIEFREDLPRNQVGRVLKYQLRSEGVTSATWDRATSGLKIARR